MNQINDSTASTRTQILDLDKRGGENCRQHHNSGIQRRAKTNIHDVRFDTAQAVTLFCFWLFLCFPGCRCFSSSALQHLKGSGFLSFLASCSTPVAHQLSNRSEPIPTVFLCSAPDCSPTLCGIVWTVCAPWDFSFGLLLRFSLPSLGLICPSPTWNSLPEKLFALHHHHRWLLALSSGADFLCPTHLKTKYFLHALELSSVLLKTVNFLLMSWSFCICSLGADSLKLKPDTFRICSVYFSHIAGSLSGGWDVCWALQYGAKHQQSTKVVTETLLCFYFGFL